MPLLAETFVHIFLFCPAAEDEEEEEDDEAGEIEIAPAPNAKAEKPAARRAMPPLPAVESVIHPEEMYEEAEPTSPVAALPKAQRPLPPAPLANANPFGSPAVPPVASLEMYEEPASVPAPVPAVDSNPFGTPPSVRKAQANGTVTAPNGKHFGGADPFNASAANPYGAPVAETTAPAVSTEPEYGVIDEPPSVTGQSTYSTMDEPPAAGNSAGRIVIDDHVYGVIDEPPIEEEGAADEAKEGGQGVSAEPQSSALPAVDENPRRVSFERGPATIAPETPVAEARASPGSVKSEKGSKGLFKLFSSKKKKGALASDNSPKGSPLTARQAKGGAAADGRSRRNSFLEQAREFEEQMRTEERRRSDAPESGASAGQPQRVTTPANETTTAPSSATTMAAVPATIYDDPRQTMLQMYKKRKHDKKAVASMVQLLSHTLTQTTRAPTMKGQLSVKQELDSCGGKAKNHKNFKTYFAILRGAVLSFYAAEHEKLPAMPPVYIPAGSVSVESHKKKGEMLRVVAVQGTFILQNPDAGELEMWKEHLSAPPPMVLDCPHYISSEAKDALEDFVSRTMNMVAPGRALRGVGGE